MSERSGGREQSEQFGASERVSGASERANGRASGTVLQSVFQAVLNHSVLLVRRLEYFHLLSLVFSENFIIGRKQTDAHTSI